MGNALASPIVSDQDKDKIRKALGEGMATADAMVTEHIQWALEPSF
jgi:epoxyqueuosine reductase